MNFKALAASALAATTIGFAMPEAKAEAWRCGRLLGYNVCAVDRSNIDSLKLEWDNGDYTWFSVYCAGRSFETKHGKQYVTYRQAQAITEAWCFG